MPVYSVPLVGGNDFNVIPDMDMNRTYYGMTSNIGVGLPGAEFHIEWGDAKTWEAARFNVFECADAMYIKIMEW